MAYLKQKGYHQSPLYTSIAIMTGCVDELFEEAYLAEQLLPNWRVHAGMVLKSLSLGQSAAKFTHAQDFFVRLADALLIRANDAIAYLTLSLLTDNFSYGLLMENCKMNIVNVDLQLNAFLTIITKLRYKSCSDKNERAQLFANMITCSFYRAISYGQVLGLHE